MEKEERQLQQQQQQDSANKGSSLAAASSTEKETSAEKKLGLSPEALDLAKTPVGPAFAIHIVGDKRKKKPL